MAREGCRSGRAVGCMRLVQQSLDYVGLREVHVAFRGLVDVPVEVCLIVE